MVNDRNADGDEDAMVDDRKKCIIYQSLKNV
jgi:hypothetical protein